jgi:glycosyltransferase involved in cell wall biosynthesis
MTRLLILTGGELTRDPRARRQVTAALALGLDVAGLSGTGGEDPVPLERIPITRVRVDRVSAALRRAGLGGMTRSRPVARELRGLVRTGRLLVLTARLARAGRGHFDVLHANDLVTLPAAWLLARRCRARLVYDAHELYTSHEDDAPRVYRLVLTALERPLARRAAEVVTVSEPIAAELERRLSLRRRPLVVLNAPALVSTPPPASAGKPLRAIYQGAMGPGRRLDDLLVAAEHAPGVALTLRIAGADRSSLEAEVARRDLGGRVEVTEPVAPDALVSALHGFEVGLVINRPVSTNDTLVFPNKLFEYMMAGLAVVVPRLPGMAPLVEGEEIGLTFEPGRPDRLGEALARLAELPDELLAMRRRAQQLAVERFNAEAEAATLARAWAAPASDAASAQHPPTQAPLAELRSEPPR